MRVVFRVDIADDSEEDPDFFYPAGTEAEVVSDEGWWMIVEMPNGDCFGVNKDEIEIKEA